MSKEDIIRRFKLIEEDANRGFDIEQETVSPRGNTKCGTILCVSGWYLEGCRRDGLFKGYPEHLIDYTEGIYLMEQHAGVGSIRDWARDNPEKWGNKYGWDMFSRERAYNGLIGGSKNPTSIVIAHWEKVDLS